MPIAMGPEGAGAGEGAGVGAGVGAGLLPPGTEVTVSWTGDACVLLSE